MMVKATIDSLQFALEQGYKNFPKIYKPPQNSRRQNGGTKQVPTNVRSHRTKFSSQGDQVPGIFAPPHYGI